MRLDELARELDLPPTRAAERAWGIARRRRRHRVAAGVATVAATLATGLVAVLGPAVETDEHPAPADAGGGSASPTALPEPPPYDGAVMTPELRLPGLLSLVSAAKPLSPHDITPLSTDPVRHAVLALVPGSVSGSARWTGVDVLGVDGRWRRVDVDGLVPTDDGNGYRGFVLGSTSLNDAGTLLALPQPDGLVVVDLTTGTSRRYDVPGSWQQAQWRDTDHVVLVQEGRPDARAVEVSTGDVADSDATARTRYLPDGSWVRWGPPGDPRTSRATDTVLTSADRTPLVTAGNDEGGLQRTAPLADRGVVVGLANLLDLDDTQRSGPIAIDRRTGAVLGVWPVSDADLANAQLLALDGDAAIIALPAADGELVLARWDWSGRSVDPVALLPADAVSVAAELVDRL